MTISLDLEPLKIAVAALIASIDELEQARACPPAPPRLTAIVQAVAYETGLPVTDICGPCRVATLFRARAAVSWLARKATIRSYGQIGIALGGRDHTSILSAIRRADQMRVADPAFRLLTDRLLRQFQTAKEN